MIDAEDAVILKSLTELNTAALIALALIVLLVYRNVIQAYLLKIIEGDRSLKQVEQKLDKIIDKIEGLENFELMISSHAKELKLLLSDLKIKLSEDDAKYLDIKYRLENLEKELEKLLKIIEKYLEIV